MSGGAKRPKRRLGGTPVAVPVPHGSTESLRIRQISNGFLITREGQKRGKWFSTEEYSPTKPVITAAAAPKAPRAQRPQHGRIRPGQSGQLIP